MGIGRKHGNMLADVKLAAINMEECWGQRESKPPFIYYLLGQAPEVNYLQEPSFVLDGIE